MKKIILFLVLATLVFFCYEYIPTSTPSSDSDYPEHDVMLNSYDDLPPRSGAREDFWGASYKKGCFGVTHDYSSYPDEKTTYAWPSNGCGNYEDIKDYKP